MITAESLLDKFISLFKTGKELNICLILLCICFQDVVSLILATTVADVRVAGYQL